MRSPTSRGDGDVRVGVAMALVGASFGLLLMLIGGGVAALGLGGLVREQRRDAVRARARSR